MPRRLAGSFHVVWPLPWGVESSWHFRGARLHSTSYEAALNRPQVLPHKPVRAREARDLHGVAEPARLDASVVPSLPNAPTSRKKKLPLIESDAGLRHKLSTRAAKKHKKKVYSSHTRGRCITLVLSTLTMPDHKRDSYPLGSTVTCATWSQSVRLPAEIQHPY